jgi:isocitrate/isopropylmalate dehydrogenase
MMLRHLGEDEAAATIENAIAAVLASGNVRTADIGGKASTSNLGEAITAEVAGLVKSRGFTSIG